MNSDRELLEKAAKAAGLVVESWTAWGSAWVYLAGAAMNSDGEPPIQKWNPLADDGDALRLAVKLDLQVRQVHFAAHAGWPDRFWRTVAHKDDKIAATRRAIVRAAAAIGDAS